MLERIAKDSGIKTPTREELAAWIASAKAKAFEQGLKVGERRGREDHQDEGRPYSYMPERAVDLDTGAIVSADKPRLRRRSLRTKATILGK